MSDLSSCELPYWVEKAKTGRAKCRGCSELIAVDCLRIAALVKSHWKNGKMPLWYHTECFFKVHQPMTIQDIANFEKMDPRHQEDIKLNFSLNRQSGELKEEHNDVDEDEDEEDEEGKEDEA